MSELTNEQIAAGAAVIGDDGKLVGRNVAIMVADAIAAAQPVAASAGIEGLPRYTGYQIGHVAGLRNTHFVELSDVERLLATQSAQGAQPDLHNAIMNLRCDVQNCILGGAQAEMAYKMGHRDARHGAAELVGAHEAGEAAPAAPLQTMDDTTRDEALSDAARDVLAERRRQIEAEGWTPKHDDEHAQGQLAEAAACYALHTEPFGNVTDYLRFWPWNGKWWKPRDRRFNLVRAGALILAEIERIDRALMKSASPVSGEGEKA